MTKLDDDQDPRALEDDDHEFDELMEEEPEVENTKASKRPRKKHAPRDDWHSSISTIVSGENSKADEALAAKYAAHYRGRIDGPVAKQLLEIVVQIHTRIAQFHNYRGRQISDGSYDVQLEVKVPSRLYADFYRAVDELERRALPAPPPKSFDEEAEEDDADDEI